MPTPLDVFMDALQKRRKCEDSFQSRNFTHTKERFSAPDAEMKCELTLPGSQEAPLVSSLLAHTHTSGTFPCADAEMECETKCEGPLTLPPEAPLHPGWLVVYRDRRGVLCGGCNDRQHGTVQECRWDGKGWTVHLTDGQRLPLSLIRSVGQTDDAGEIVAAWTVREHGYDGEGPVEGRRLRAEP